MFDFLKLSISYMSINAHKYTVAWPTNPKVAGSIPASRTNQNPTSSVVHVIGPFAHITLRAVNRNRPRFTTDLSHRKMC